MNSQPNTRASIETILEAWRKYHRAATSQPGEAFSMSIPAKQGDPDIILKSAIVELSHLRHVVELALRECKQSGDVEAIRIILESA